LPPKPKPESERRVSTDRRAKPSSGRRSSDTREDHDRQTAGMLAFLAREEGTKPQND
jgi:hypothetical protein